MIYDINQLARFCPYQICGPGDIYIYIIYIYSKKCRSFKELDHGDNEIPGVGDLIVDAT